MLFFLLFSFAVFLPGIYTACQTQCSGKVTRLANKIKEMEALVTESAAAAQENGGATGLGTVYTRWGRKNCPDQNSLLYEGIASGSFYSHVGGGTNFICLPSQPEMGTIKKAVHSCNGYIYGAEYEVTGRELFSNENFVGDLHNQDVPCAVCQATKRQSKLFIPAKSACPSGWTKEYQGYVMSSHYAHRRSEWVCVDNAPETNHYGTPNLDGALFYYAEVSCGSLPCPPYTNGQEIPCVVCTK